jgi:hypothetical protein
MSFRTFLSLLAVVGSPFIMKYREKIGDFVGDAEWMHKVGGVHNLIVILSVLFFFWGIAELTGTTTILFGGIKFLSPGLQAPQGGGF